MPTSCRTHDYDGELRAKWFEIRPMLLERVLPNCLSFEDTVNDIEQWLDRKYFNVKRIGRARRSIRILRTQRPANFDSKNEIDVEELLPILWNKVKNQEDIHDTFYEQFCDITGGSCSQGRSTRLFQFLFLFDLPIGNDQQQSTATTTTENRSVLEKQIDGISSLSIEEKNKNQPEQTGSLEKKLSEQETNLSE